MTCRLSTPQLLLSAPSSGFLACPVPDLGLPVMDRNPGVPRALVATQCAHRPRGEDCIARTQVVEESQQTLCGEQLVIDCNQGSVLAECVQCWHQRVALLSSLSLDDLVRDPLIVIPPVRRRRTVELPHEKESGGSTFHLQIRSNAMPSTDNKVVFPSRSVRVWAFASQLGGESELERRSCTFDGGGAIVERECHNSAHTTRRLLQRCHAVMPTLAKPILANTDFG